MTGLNAERALIAAECIGDGYWFVDKVTAYTSERKVFGRPIGQNLRHKTRCIEKGAGPCADPSGGGS